MSRSRPSPVVRLAVSIASALPHHDIYALWYLLPCTGWYYFGPREAGSMVRRCLPTHGSRRLTRSPTSQPKHPTLSSFIRASTLSLGSIAFGSLIVTILELIRMILNAARNSANADGHRTSLLSADR